MKVCGWTGYRTQDLWLLSQTRLRHAARPDGIELDFFFRIIFLFEFINSSKHINPEKINGNNKKTNDWELYLKCNIFEEMVTSYSKLAFTSVRQGFSKNEQHK